MKRPREGEGGAWDGDWGHEENARGETPAGKESGGEYEDPFRRRNAELARRYFEMVPRRERLVRRLEAMAITTAQQTFAIMDLYDGATPDEKAVLAEEEIRHLLRLIDPSLRGAEGGDAGDDQEDDCDPPVVVRG